MQYSLLHVARIYFRTGVLSLQYKHPTYTANDNAPSEKYGLAVYDYIIAT